MTLLPGASPLRPQHKTKNLSMKENRKHPTPSRWSGQHLPPNYEKNLPELATKG